MFISKEESQSLPLQCFDRAVALRLKGRTVQVWCGARVVVVGGEWAFFPCCCFLPDV
jgi:hypothetical protein